MIKLLPYFSFRACIVFCSLFLSAQITAQICTGSLGDAVVNVTFGSGNNPGSALPSNITNYSYTFGSCPGDGSYTIVNSSANCFGSTWHSISQDYTGKGSNGYMMLVNASFTPGDFYVDTVKNLCASTTYEFSAWVLNVLKPTSCSSNPIHPNLVFNIETTTGVVLGTYASGDILETTDPLWKQYGLFFTTPSLNNSVVIRITNNSRGGCGNDLALDDITFRPCGPAVKATIINTTATTINICKDKIIPVTLSATIGSGYTSPSLQWQESLNNGTTWTDILTATSNNFLFTTKNTGTYQYRLTVAEGSNIGISNCRVASNPDTIIIRELPVANASNNGPVCENSQVLLSASGGEKYNWSGPNGYSAVNAAPSLTSTLFAAGQYTVIISDAYGCQASASTTIAIKPKPVITLSNNKVICKGDSVQLESSGGISYRWMAADGITDITSPNPFVKPAASITYSVVVADADGCEANATVTVIVNTIPVANAGPDKFILIGNNVALEGVVSDQNINFFWTPADFINNPLIKNPVTNTSRDITYTLHAVSTIGCGTASDDVFVKVFAGLNIPNAFSPNNDGKNDTWHIDALSAFPKAVLSVYNRYGQKIFESTGNKSNWEGNYKGQQVGTGLYVYFINLNNGKPLIKGNVLLIR